MSNAESPFVIVGCGGHARVVIGMLKQSDEPIKALLSDDDELDGTSVLGIPVFSSHGYADLSPDRARMANGVGNRASRRGTGLGVRASIYDRYRSQNFTFPPLISRYAAIQPDCGIDDAVQIMPGAVVQIGVRIGANTIVNTSASIDHDSSIGVNCHIAPGAVLCGGVTVGDMTHIGAGAVIVQGIRIGARAMIGAGVVVSRDVPDGAILTRLAESASE